MRRIGLIVIAAMVALTFAGCRSNTPVASAEPTVAITTPAPMPTLIATPTPTPAPTPRPAPTLKPAEAPGELHALSFDTALAVFGVMGEFDGKIETRFYDLSGAPGLDAEKGYGSFRNQLMVPAASVLQALGYTIVFEDEKGLEAKRDTDTLAFNVGEDAMVRDGQRLPLPEGGKPAEWKSSAVWVAESMLPLPDTYARIQDGTIITLDFTSKNDATGRAQALKLSQKMWTDFPK